MAIHDRESFGIQGIVLDLNPEPMIDQLTKLTMLGRIIRINTEQELLIAGVQKGLPTQGSCVRPDGQNIAELIDVWLAEVSAQYAVDRQLAAHDLRRTEARIDENQTCGAANGKPRSQS